MPTTKAPSRKPDPLPPGWKAVKIVKEWSGSADDLKQLTKLPEKEVITDAATFAKLWEALKPGEKAPELDFSKVFVVRQISQSTKVYITAQIREKGDMMLAPGSYGREAPGFRYIVKAIDREGIQSVNFEPLKK